ncbi:MAG: efflux transporter outer membrane subunit [Pseudomonadota bacterium]
MTTMKTSLVLPAFFALALTGCTAIGPDYNAPDIQFESKFVGGASQDTLEASELAWWRYLNDPVLNDLVSIGLDQNLDVRSALERIVEARENARRFGAAEQLNGDISLTSRRSRNDAGDYNTESNATADAFYVFDLFGEFSSAQERSLAELEAAEFDVGTVKLAYLADVVSSYILVRYFQTAAQITRQSITTRRQTLNIVNQRAAASDSTQLEVAQAQSLLANAQASLPLLEAQARVNAFRIATLLGTPTTTVLNKLGVSTTIPTPSGGLAIGVPADLLRNRPDIRASERRLAAATSDIGVAAARLYPALRLNGTVSSGDTDSWSFGPSLDIPVFDRSRRDATRNIAISDAKQAELGYRNEVFLAVEEVQAAMALTDARQRQFLAFTQAVATAERVQTLSRESYEGGVVTLDEVLDAERTRLANRLDQALSLSEWAQAWVQMQVSLGKGWQATSATTLAAAIK